MKWNYGNIQENEVSSDFFILTDHCSGVCLKCRRSKFNLSVRKILWRRKWQPTPVFLPGVLHGQRILAGYSPWSHKESDMTEWLTHTHTTHTYTHIHTWFTYLVFIHLNFDKKQISSGQVKIILVNLWYLRG